MNYIIAERFKSIQGEGVYAGTPMAFIRFAGCSVGKKICNACDTDFERPIPWKNGGVYDEYELASWCAPYRHACLTGGEPFDQELAPLLSALGRAGLHVHIETSGTVLNEMALQFAPWICVSPKPGYRQDMLEAASEIKVIVPGLAGGGFSSAQDDWPNLDDVLSWLRRFPTTPIFLQPRNGKYDVDRTNLAQCIELVNCHPGLRLSVQMHKILRVQ